MSMLVAVLPGCKRKPGAHAYLRPLSTYIDYHKTKQGITLRAKKLSAEDCKSLLGTRAALLFKKRRRKKPIFPIQISITNQTRSLVALQPKDIDLELTPYNDVAHRLQRSSFAQAFGKLFGGIAIAGTLIAGSIIALSTSGVLLVVIGSIKAFAPAALIGSSALLITPFFLVVATPAVSTATVVRTSRQNTAIKQELKANSLRHTVLVEPGETLDTLIFVTKQQYKQEFDITMRNPHNPQNRIPFHVKLLDHA
jgi:hypothetical protein